MNRCPHVDHRGRRCIRSVHRGGFHGYKRLTIRRRATDSDVKQALLERSLGRCEVAWDGLRCTRAGDHAHHRLRRSQGGTDDVDNLLWVCAPCHAQIHSWPLASYARGYLLHRGRVS